MHTLLTRARQGTPHARPLEAPAAVGQPVDEAREPDGVLRPSRRTLEKRKHAPLTSLDETRRDATAVRTRCEDTEALMVKRPPAAQTALGPMVIVATEQYVPEHQRLIHDELAVRFLPPHLRLTARACRWRFLRDLMVNATAKRAPGMWGGVLCRKRYADDQVAEAVDAGIGQVVILGAGLDTRAYRLVAPVGVPAFEIDLPANIADKRTRLQRIYRRMPEHVSLIPVDFETQDLGDALAANGFEVERPAMFVWEAVTQYLTEDAVRATLAFLSKAAGGSRLIFTYLRKDFLDGTNLSGAEEMYQEFVIKHRVWHFGVAPEHVDDLLRGYGWDEREQVGGSEYLERYVWPAGRDLPVSEIERFVLAEKR